jgi:SAM-dependent methyltransferase
MAHKEQFDYINNIKSRFPTYFSNTKVLEIGSLDINGSIRQFFDECDYTGVDLGPGKGVDIISRGEELLFQDESFDVTISCECFEHNDKWAETFTNMIRMTKPGGLVLFTCATTGRKEHGTRRTNPSSSPYAQDYYRNLTEIDFENIAFKSSFKQFVFSTNHIHHDLQFYGVKND